MNSTNSDGDYAAAAGVFLRILRALPEELARQTPLLCDIARLGDGGAERAALPGPVQRRLDRRYARIGVVYRELGKLDFNKAGAGTSLEDMVYAQTDFALYRKISREDFRVFFDEGLEDFEDSFYKYNLMMDRDAVRGAISRWYRNEGDYYVCAGENPLLQGIMRSLHTALDFAPLLRAEDILGESAFLVRFLQSQSALGEEDVSALTENQDRLFYALLRSLDKAIVIHPDGMATTLFIEEGPEPPVLFGTFRPENRAHTIRLTRGG
jgi:hypothetical protein